MSFAEMKKNRKERLQTLHQSLTSAGQGKGKDQYVDDRFWKLTCKEDVGSATIRFLQPKGDIEYTQYYDHGIKGKTHPQTGRPQYYIEKSLTSLGLKDPVSEYNSMLWNAGHEDKARSMKRRLHYVANIIVIKDKAKPETEGNVFLFEFGAQIFKLIQEAFEPPMDEEGRKPDDPEYSPENRKNVFDLWEGPNFMLDAVRKSSGYRTYENSRFVKKGPVAKTEELIEQIYESTHDLEDILDPKHFKSYDELKARFHKIVLGNEIDVGASEDAPSSREEAPSESTEASFASNYEDDDDIDLDSLIGELNEEK